MLLLHNLVYNVVGFIVKDGAGAPVEKDGIRSAYILTSTVSGPVHSRSNPA